MLGWEQIFLSTRQVGPPVTLQLVDLSWNGSYFTIFSIRLSDLLIAISTDDPHLTLSLKPKGAVFFTVILLCLNDKKTLLLETAREIESCLCL